MEMEDDGLQKYLVSVWCGRQKMEGKGLMVRYSGDNKSHHHFLHFIQRRDNAESTAHNELKVCTGAPACPFLVGICNSTYQRPTSGSMIGRLLSLRFSHRRHTHISQRL